MALNGLFCADVPLRNYSLTHSAFHPFEAPESSTSLSGGRFTYVTVANNTVWSHMAGDAL